MEDQEKGNLIGLMVISIMVCGEIIWNMDKVFIKNKTVIAIMGNGLMIKLMEQVLILWLMEMSIKVVGKEIKEMDME